MTKYEALQKLIGLLRKDAYEAATLVAHYADETKKLRAFAVEVMSAWPEGYIDGGYLQNIAEKHGMLVPETRYEPCGESCHCANYCDSEDWEQGITCYRRTWLLTRK